MIGSRFELDLPEVSPADLEERARPYATTRRSRRWIRIRDDMITARYAPGGGWLLFDGVLRGRVVQHSDGLRLVGRVWWGNELLRLAPWVAYGIYLFTSQLVSALNNAQPTNILRYTLLGGAFLYVFYRLNRGDHKGHVVALRRELESILGEPQDVPRVAPSRAETP